MDTEFVHEVHEILPPEYIESIPPPRLRKYNSVALTKQTVLLLRTVDPLRRLSDIIVYLCDNALRRGLEYHNGLAVSRYRQALQRVYGSLEVYSTTLGAKAIARLKEVRGRLGFRSLADALDYVTVVYLKERCKDQAFRSRVTICGWAFD